jgi:UDP-glucose 4-epimerase
MVPYDEAYGEGFEELGRRRPDTTALEQMTGWRSTRGVEDAIDDLAAYERVRLADPLIDAQA